MTKLSAALRFNKDSQSPTNKEYYSLNGFSSTKFTNTHKDKGDESHSNKMFMNSGNFSSTLRTTGFHSTIRGSD